MAGGGKEKERKKGGMRTMPFILGQFSLNNFYFFLIKETKISAFPENF
jgi:hypothetical protein